MGGGGGTKGDNAAASGGGAGAAPAMTLEEQDQLAKDVNELFRVSGGMSFLCLGGWRRQGYGRWRRGVGGGRGWGAYPVAILGVFMSTVLEEQGQLAKDVHC